MTSRSSFLIFIQRYTQGHKRRKYVLIEIMPPRIVQDNVLNNDSE